MHVAVVGAGPAGSVLAYLLAARGHKVELYDMENVYKSPCGEAVPRPEEAEWGPVWGIVRNAVASTVLNDVYGFRIVVYNGGDSRKEKVKTWKYVVGYVLSKHAFVRKLRFMAEAEGAEFIVKRVDPRMLASSRQYDVVVDARGPQTDLHGARLAVIQCYASGGSQLSTSHIHLYMFRDYVGYAWVFPRGGKWNVGSGCLGCNGHRLYDTYFTVMRDEDLQEEKRPRGWTIIAEPPPRIAELHGSTVLLRVGEAAGHVMYHSGEGIRPAIMSAYYAADIIHRHRDSPPGVLAEAYERQMWRTPIGRQAAASYRILALIERLAAKGMLADVVSMLPASMWPALFSMRGAIYRIVSLLARFA